MALKFVVGRFESKGSAEDAVNRLKYEGVAAANVSLLLMHETTAGGAAAVSPELAAVEVGPVIVCDGREGYGRFIYNGETAVFVPTHSDDEIDLAVATIRLYAPIKIKVVASGEGAPLSHDIL